MAERRAPAVTERRERGEAAGKGGRDGVREGGSQGGRGCMLVQGEGTCMRKG